jgi:hypothetical protein
MPARPDLEAELLLAMGLRDASTSLRLVQQLVHRRGVGALESLRCRSLAIEPDQRGWIWLSQLGPDAAASTASPQRPAAVVSPQGVDVTAAISPGVDAAAQPMELEPSVLPVPSLGLAPAAAPLVSAAPMDLNLRVETAVDAAFEALAAEFPGHGRLAAAESGRLGFAAVQTGLIQPEPLVLDQQELFEPELVQLELVHAELVQTGLSQAELVSTDFVSTELVSTESAQPVGNHQPEPSSQVDPFDQTGESDQVNLAGLAEGWFAIEAPSLELAEPCADLEEPPAELFSVSQPYASLEQRPRPRFSFVIPRPLDQELAGAELSTTNAASAESWQQQGAGDCGQEQGVEGPGVDPSLVGQAARLWHRAEGRMGGLRDRVRRRLSLARLKVLVQDCVEEAVSSFQGSNPLVEPQQQGTLEQASEAVEAAAPEDSWAQEPALAAPAPGGGGFGSEPAIHQAPVAAFGPPLAGESLAPLPVVAEAPARLSTTQQVRQRLLGRRQDETPPAPAPQALSDLRAWLAADDDLPRAS